MVWGTFFLHVCPFDRGGGGLKLFWQCPYRTNTFQKGASLRWLPCARACVRFGEDETFAASEAFMLHFEGERRRLGVENRSSGEENFLTN